MQVGDARFRSLAPTVVIIYYYCPARHGMQQGMQREWDHRTGFEGLELRYEKIERFNAIKLATCGSLDSEPGARNNNYRTGNACLLA